MKRLIDIAVRLILIAAFLSNAVIPSIDVLAAQQAKPASSEQPKPTADGGTLPELTPIYYQPPAGPSATAKPSWGNLPRKSYTPTNNPNFTISAQPNVVMLNDTLTLTVTLRNPGRTTKTGVLFSDSLKKGFEYIADPNSPVVYNNATREISYEIGILDSESSVTFSYKLKVVVQKENKPGGEVRVHKVKVTDSSGASKKMRVTIGVSGSLLKAGTNLSVVSPNGGWNDLGKISVYADKNAIGPNVVLTASRLVGARAVVKAHSPETQYQLNMLQTTAISTDDTGDPDEQSVDIQGSLNVPFTEPIVISFDLTDNIDLSNIPAGEDVYVATYDDANGVWVKIPIVEKDLATNTVSVQAAHFSTWGVGLGSSLPQNGANVLLFDQPYASLFAGSAQYSVPIWMPQGRNGMTPSLALSYSSATYNGVLGDIQAPWVGGGWNIDGVEIVRKITTNENAYGFENNFSLTINGAMYQLVQDTLHPSRYFTNHNAFLYVERHSFALRNAGAVANDTGEWWEVVTTDGTRYRLGWNKNSEQLAMMYGYACKTGNPCITPTGSYQFYGGIADNLVAMRWRVDQVIDTHKNKMEYTYKEEVNSGPIIPGPKFDRASYLETISYSFLNSTQAGYQVEFVSGDRSAIGDNVPNAFNMWDNYDTRYLDRINIIYYKPERVVVRTYDLNYHAEPVPNSNGTLVLGSIDISGGGYSFSNNYIPAIQSATIRFTYQDMDNRAPNGVALKYPYPRLTNIQNGYGGSLTYEYGNDGRAADSWYNWRVTKATVESGLGISTLHTYTYTSPVYSDGTPAKGELVGYTDVTDSSYNPLVNPSTKISDSQHHFGTADPDKGYELWTQQLDPTGTVLQKTVNTYVSDNSMAPFPGWTYRYLYETDNYQRVGSNLVLISKTISKHDPSTGTLAVSEDYLGSSLYRKQYYEYLSNFDPAVYILGKVSRAITVDTNNAIFADTHYHYDGDFRGIAAPTKGELTLTQRLVTADQTSDVVYGYDDYGNRTSTCAYVAYGHINTLPTGTCRGTTTNYDTTLHIYPVKVTDSMLNSTTADYIYELGIPYQSTDPNGWVSTSTFDGLGRTLTTTSPGLNKAGVKYTYPSGNVNAPYSIRMDILDTLSGNGGVYRQVWGYYDGLGRVIQSQVRDDDTGLLLVTDSLYGPQGIVKQNTPHTIAGTGRVYLTPSWVQYSTNTYDALGRILSTVSIPSDITTSTSYDGLQVTITDPNNHVTKRTSDAFGRMGIVEEITASGSNYTYYAYDIANNLVRMRDSQNNSSVIQYDLLGRKTIMQDVDLGEWIYRYDALSNLVAQIDAKAQAINFYYDDLNRIKGKTYSNPVDPKTYLPPSDSGNYPVKFTYGSQAGEIGMRVGMTDLSGSTSWDYSDFGRAVTETRTINNITKSFTTTGDWLGRPLTITYPGSDKVTYRYNALGQPVNMESSAHPGVTLAELAYNALGQTTNMLLGNHVNVANKYNSAIAENANTGTDRLTSRIATNANQNLLMSFTYGYDAGGNITSIVDDRLHESLSYQYDNLNRLTQARDVSTTSGNTPIYQYNYSYDNIGNILRVDQSSSMVDVQPSGSAHLASLARPAFSSIGNNPGTTGLVSWWTLDETSGVRSDSFGTNHLSDINTVGYSSVETIGNAADFTAANSEALTIPDNASLSLTGNMTIGAWVYFPDTQIQSYVVSKWNSAENQRSYALQLNNGVMTFSVSGDGLNTTSVTSSEIYSNTWTYVLAWYSGSKLYISLNGELANYKSYAGGIYDGTADFSIGSAANTVFSGQVDEVAIYSRDLTTYERQWFIPTLGSGHTYTDLLPPSPTPTATFTPSATSTSTPTATSTSTPTNTPELSCSGDGLSREVWTGISGTTVNSLVTASNNFSNTPNISETISSFESPENYSDNYGQRLRGLLCVPSSGNYTFWIASDETSSLRINLATLSLPSGANWTSLGTGANQIAFTSAYTGLYEWDKYSTQKATLALVAGYYYIEARMKEAAGSDHLAVSWKFNDSTTPVGAANIIQTSNLLPAPGMPTTTPTLVTTLTPSATHAATATPISQNIFTDVTPGPYKSSIESIYYAGITSGCGTFTYCPAGKITRDIAAVLILRAEHGSSYTPPGIDNNTGFTDVPNDHWAAAWIKQFSAEGITSGCAYGTYCPSAEVTLDQMAIFLLRAKHGSSYSPPAVGPTEVIFADVTGSTWAAAWIKEAALEGIRDTSGTYCASGSYCPTFAVRRDQMALLLDKTFNISAWLTATPIISPTPLISPTATAPRPNTATPTPTATPNLSTNLVGWWHFDDTTGGTPSPNIADSSGSGNFGTLTGGVRVAGANGWAISLNEGSYVRVPSAASLQPLNGLTISAWVYPGAQVFDNSKIYTIVNKGGANPNQDYGLQVNKDGFIEFRMADLTPAFVTGPKLPQLRWSMVTATYDKPNGLLKIYINGILSASKLVTAGTVSYDSNSLYFGYTAHSWLGSLDEVRFYANPLKDADVAWIYANLPIPTAAATSTFTSTPYPSPTATPLPANAIQWGNGADGSLSVTSGIYNINVDHSISRTCADAVAYSVVSLGEITANLSVTPETGCLQLGDEVMLVNLQDPTGSMYSAGVYEFLRVNSVDASTVNFSTPKTKYYGTSFQSDTGIGTGAGQQRVMLVRVPNYSSVINNGVITGNSWDGQKYGLLAFRVSGTLSGSGTIEMNGKGYSSIHDAGGDSPAGTISNGGGGRQGAGTNSGDDTSRGGGGAYAGAGERLGDSDDGAGGKPYGTSNLERMFMGSAGGFGGEIGRSSQGTEPGGQGGNGGGIVFFAANTISMTSASSITSKGADGQCRCSVPDERHAGGSGAGGSVRIEGSSISLGTLSAEGGTYSANGGQGRLAIYYAGSTPSVNSSNPAYYPAPLGLPATSTPTPTSISFPTWHNWGTGLDGNLLVNTGQALDLSSPSSNQDPARSCSQGGEVVSYSVISLTFSSARVSPAPATGCLKAGDEILLINTMGNGTNNDNVGNYEFLRVGGITNDIIQFTTVKIRNYGANKSDDSDIGNSQQVRVVRVPNFKDVTVNGTLTATTGILPFRVSGTYSGSGYTNTDGKGYGSTYDMCGMSPNGSGCNGGGGQQGPIRRDQVYTSYGGGGGYATAGEKKDGTYPGGAGGRTYGDENLARIFSGGAGGYGGTLRPRNGDPDEKGGAGGSGGGIIFVSGNIITITGGISSIGANGQPSFGGSGAGGSIRIEGGVVNINLALVNGGTNVESDGSGAIAAGGKGRIAIYYETTFTGNFTPGYIEKVVSTVTPIPWSSPTLVVVTPGPIPTGTGLSPVTYSYANPQHVHAVTALSSGNSYEYDANGNMVKRVIHGTSDVTWTINYDAENRTTSIGNAVDYGINYLYDGDGVRVGEYTSGTATYYFAGGAYEVTGTLTGSNPVLFTQTGVKKYYSIAGQMVAMDVKMNTPSDEDGLKYFLTDHLGSMMVVVGATGALISEQRYLPFGGLRNLSGSAVITQTDFGYTGQRNNSYTGLMDYKARMYDPALGRFLQPDSIIPGMGNPQSLNRFSYVQNRPVIFNDPTGHMQENDDEYSSSYGVCKPGDTSCNWMGNSPGKDPGYTEDSHDRRDKPPKTHHGTIYANIYVNTLEDYDNRNFGNKAEESYNDFGPQYEPVLNSGAGGWYLITNGISLLEDAFGTGKKLPVYPISVAINWQQTGKTGPMVFNSVTITNGAPAFIRDPSIRINTARFGGTSSPVGRGGSLTVDLKGYSVPHAARKNILIEVTGYGQTAPDYPHALVISPGGFSPSPGCSSPVLCAIP